MTLPTEKDRWEVELRQLREELHALREEQRELARSVEQLVQAFRAIATHLGITAEPYVRKEKRDRDLPGFA
jgi:LPS O-antigen subunit length determinant protein (WzzB/FepE family)